MNYFDSSRKNLTYDAKFLFWEGIGTAKFLHIHKATLIYKNDNTYTVESRYLEFHGALEKI
jgi:hypothetical protein